MVNQVKENQKYYLQEYEYFDGEEYITFNIVNLDFAKQTIEFAITNRGKISVIETDLFLDNNGKFYFKFGPMLEKIKLEDFETKNKE